MHAKRKKQSKLTEYKDEIFQLKSMGFAEKVIVDFLAKKKNVHVSQQTLNQFIRSQSESQQTSSQAQNQHQERAKTIQAAQPKPQQPETHAPRPLRKPTPTKRFDMSEKIDPETLK